MSRDADLMRGYGPEDYADGDEEHGELLPEAVERGIACDACGKPLFGGPLQHLPEDVAGCTWRCFAPCALAAAGLPCQCVPNLDALHAKDVNDPKEEQ